MHPQIPLPLKLHDDYTFASFVEDDNAFICQTLKGTDEPFIFLAGGDGLGKTHLLQATCQYATDEHKTASYLPLKELHNYSAEMLNGMQAISLICIDDIQMVCGNSAWETALFNLFNKIKQCNGRLIVSASLNSNRLPIKLMDLKSRLGSGLPLNLEIPNDSVIKKALMIRAKKLGLELGDDVCNFLLTRFPRNLHILINLLEQLDQATLSAQRKLTVPFLKKFVANLG